MIKKIIPFLLSAILISILSLNACATKQESISLRIGTMPTQTAAIYAIAKEKGFFQNNNLDVDLKIFNSAIERDSAATAKQLDAFLTDIMGLVNLTQHDFKFKATSSEYENFSIISSNANIKSVLDLSGKKLAISKNTVADYIAETLFNKNSKGKKQYESISIPKVPERMAALLGKKVDAAVFPEPFTSMITSKGGKVLASSAKNGMQPVIFVFSDEIINNNAVAIDNFYKAYKESVEYLKNHDIKEYKDVLVKYGIAKKETVIKTKLPVSKYIARQKVTEKDVNGVLDWMKSRGIIKAKPNYNDLVYIK